MKNLNWISYCKRKLKFIKNFNTILICVLIMAAFVVLKFSKLPSPEFLPNFIIDLFERPANNSDALELLRILEELSLAYIAALTTYFLIDFVPKKRLEKKAYTISKPKIISIYSNMSRIIGPVKMLLDLKKENKEILLSDLKELVNYDPSLEKTYFNKKTFVSDIGANGETKGVFLYHLDFSRFAINTRKLIDEITSLPSSVNLPVKLMNILSSIRSSSFIEKWYLSKDSPVENLPYTNYNHDVSFYEFIQLYLALEKFDFSKYYFVYTKLNDEEISLVINEQNKKFVSISKKITQPEMNLVLNGIEYRIEAGKLRQ